MSFGGEPGFRARQRVDVSGMSIAERDELVLAAGGRIVKHNIPSRGLRPGRLFERTQEVSYYLIPERAFER